ncbi:MAG TPA: hypothetical protein VKR30_01850 [Candidatus Limnocylindrales bacterium]|nr:hypothetical protein [Candidatus Limnocylindrales bacterium]
MNAIVSLVLLVAGAVLTAIGWSRARGPYARYRQLQAEDANVARYEAWRGGLRDSGTTGASVAMTMLRRQARQGFAMAGVGVLLFLAALLLLR